MNSPSGLPGPGSPTVDTIIRRHPPARSAPAPGRPSATAAVASRAHAHSAACRAHVHASVTASLGQVRRSSWTAVGAGVAIHPAVQVNAPKVRKRARRNTARARVGARRRDGRAPTSAAPEDDDCTARDDGLLFLSAWLIRCDERQSFRLIIISLLTPNQPAEWPVCPAWSRLGLATTVSSQWHNHGTESGGTGGQFRKWQCGVIQIPWWWRG